MTARIFVHPRCVPEGRAHDLLVAALEAHGWPPHTMIGPPSTKGHRELVQRVEAHEDGSYTYARCDGTRFRYPAPKEAA